MERFFVGVARLNSVLLLLLLVGGLAGLFLVWSDSRGSSRPTVTVQEGPNAQTKEFTFNQVEQVQGSAIQLVQLVTDRERGKIASGGYRYDSVNLLFVHDDGKSHWLFQSNAQRILRVKQLRAKNADDTVPTRAIYLEYVNSDSDQDGVLSEADVRQLAVTAVDGSQLKLVLQNVGQVLSVDMLGADTLTVLYQKATTVRQARFSLQQMMLQSDVQIAELPTTPNAS